MEIDNGVWGLNEKNGDEHGKFVCTGFTRWESESSNFCCWRLGLFGDKSEYMVRGDWSKNMQMKKLKKVSVKIGCHKATINYRPLKPKK